MQEIERKFLVKSNAYREQAYKRSTIKQGFLNLDPQRTVRVRVKRNSAQLTVKGLSSDDGLSRHEWEIDIPKKDALFLLDLCHNEFIEKERYEVKCGEHVFEIDEFHGSNEGLVLAEIELNDENESFVKPDWLGTEVTGQPEYYNANLSVNPYLKWAK
ncbi:MAG: CYTH domain-containing protein [Flavobacteriaceae bacterium]|nr:CYTH domain-containing protein [Bacteroidia bacterium]NNK88531.1 CYTH domain-containing protein [Flavobacteriaceae bacterium]